MSGRLMGMVRPVARVLLAAAFLIGTAAGRAPAEPPEGASAHFAGGGRAPGARSDARSGREGAVWSFLVYMCADNNLSSAGWDDLNEMERVGSTDCVNVVAQLDTQHDSARRYYVVLDEDSTSVGSTVVAELGEINMASPEALTEFGLWAIENYPAERFCLVLWDHGNGWYSEGGGALGGPPRSYGQDYSAPGSTIGVANGQLREALLPISEAAGQGVDVVVFDACSMGMIEVAGELWDLAGTLVASEQTVPFDGCPYGMILRDLTLDPQMSGAALSSRIVADYCDFYRLQGSSVTMSAVDPQAVLCVEDEIRELVAAFVADPDTGAVGEARRAAQTFNTGSGGTPHYWDDYVDLAHVAALIGEHASGGLAAAGRAVAGACSNAVIAEDHNGGNLADSRGIACWFPETAAEFADDAWIYHYLGFAGRSSWHHFLGTLYISEDGVPPSVPYALPVVSRQGGEYEIAWRPSFDAGIVEGYGVQRLGSVETLLYDDAESGGDGWEMQGFEVRGTRYRSPYHCYFSSSGYHDMTLEDPIELGSGTYQASAWMMFAIAEDEVAMEYSLDEVSWDTLFAVTRQPMSDSAWVYRAGDFTLGESSDVTLRVRYSGMQGRYGCHLDDIGLASIDPASIFSVSHPDTSLVIVPQQAGSFWYRVRAVDRAGNASSWSQPVYHYVSPHEVTDRPCLATPYPNPSGGVVTIEYAARAQGAFDLAVYDLSGRRVRRLARGAEVGQGSLVRGATTWDGKGACGNRVGAGIYFVRISSGPESSTAKLVRLPGGPG